MENITILVRVLWPGGPQRIAFNETRLLREAGFNTSLVFIRETRRKVKEFDEISHEVIFDKNISRRISQKIFSMITKHYNQGRGEDATVDLDLIARYELSRNNSDVVIYLDQFTSLFSILRKIRKPFKKIVYIHETAFREASYFKRVVERVALSKTDYIITHSYFNMKILNEKGYKNVELLYPGIELSSSILEFDKRSDTCIIVTVFEPWRKPELLLDIAKNLQSTKIIMAGQWADENYRKNIEKEVAKLGLSDKIIITGLIDQIILDNLYKTSKVAMRFGFDEHGPGMGALEAIGYGIPLVVNRGIGITELLDKYNYDLIFEDFQADKIAQVIDRLITNRDYWERYHKEIMTIAADNSWKKHGDHLCSLINKVRAETS